MKEKNKSPLPKIVFPLSLLVLVATQTTSAKTNPLALTQAEMQSIVNGKIEKVQAARRFVPQAKPVYHRPAPPVRRTPAKRPPVKHTPARRASVTKRPPARRAVQHRPRPPVQTRYRRPQAKRYVAPVRRVAPPANLPAWRRPASHTETRGSGDAIFAAAKNRNMRLLQQILESGVDINHRNFNGETALHIAASLGNVQMVNFLLANGAQINGLTGKRWLPIHHAIRFNHPVVANILIARGASLWQKNSDGLSPLDFAAKSNNPRIKAIARSRGR